MRPADHLAGCMLAAVLLCLPPAAPALDSDRKQPIHLESDKASIDEQQGVNIFTGNVHLQQGTLNLRGHRMVVYITDGSISRAEIDGSPATFVQRPEGQDSDMHASARRMEYYASDERIILLGEARVWDTQGYDFRSERIDYHLTKNTVDAGGGGDNGGRVHITLPPRQISGENDKEAETGTAP